MTWLGRWRLRVLRDTPVLAVFHVEIIKNVKTGLADSLLYIRLKKLPVNAWMPWVVGHVPLFNASGLQTTSVSTEGKYAVNDPKNVKYTRRSIDRELGPTTAFLLKCDVVATTAARLVLTDDFYCLAGPPGASIGLVPGVPVTTVHPGGHLVALCWVVLSTRALMPDAPQFKVGVVHCVDGSVSLRSDTAWTPDELHALWPMTDDGPEAPLDDVCLPEILTCGRPAC